MAYENSPSSVMYAELKALGLSNRDVAITLLDTERSFGDTTVMDRVESRTRLSRDIVHVAPGALSPALFRDFGQSVQTLLGRAIAKLKGDSAGNPAQIVAERISGESADAMQASLREYGIDDSVFRNAITHIDNLNIGNETDRTLLYFMLFVVTGCTGDPHKAAQTVERFSSDIVGSSFKTTMAEVGMAEDQDEDEALHLGLMRVVGGKLKGVNAFYRLSTAENGSEIGTLASGEGAITDVDADVSRRHARVYKQGSHWYIIGLKSTNGTTVISGEDKMEHVVEPPRGERARDYVPEPFEILPTDTICLGSSTRFMVMPVLE